MNIKLEVVNLKQSDEIAKHLIGKTITNVGYLNKKTCRNFGWIKSPLIIELNDKSKIFAVTDENGYEAGILFTTLPEIPIILNK